VKAERKKPVFSDEEIQTLWEEWQNG